MEVELPQNPPGHGFVFEIMLHILDRDSVFLLVR